MTKNTTKTAAVAAGTMLFDDWFDPIEDVVRARVRGVIETIMEEDQSAIRGLGNSVFFLCRPTR
jgi:hypothetical protein